MSAPFNPRFILYARAHGREPEAMLDHDRERFPGGLMAGFLTWISERWQAWDSKHGHSRDHARSRDEHTAFDAWLTETCS